MNLTKKVLLFALTQEVRNRCFGGESPDNTTFLDVVKLFPNVEPDFKLSDLGYASYEALANDLAETLEALGDDDGGDIIDNVVNEFKQNPIKTSIKASGILGAVISGVFGLFG